MAAILKWPKIYGPSDFYLMASTIIIGGGLMSKKNRLTQKMTENAREIRLNSCL